MSSDAPALMSAWTDDRCPWRAAQCSAVNPSLCGQGRGVIGWPRGFRGYPTSSPVRFHSACGPEGTRFFPLFETARAPEGYLPLPGIPPATRAAAPNVKPPNEMGKTFETERRGKIGNREFGQAGMGTHSSGRSRFCPPSRSKFCMQHKYWNGKRRDGLSSGFGEAWAWQDWPG